MEPAIGRIGLGFVIVCGLNLLPSPAAGIITFNFKSLKIFLLYIIIYNKNFLKSILFIIIADKNYFINGINRALANSSLEPFKYFTNSKAKNIAVAGPLEVMTLSSHTTISFSEYSPSLMEVSQLG